MARFFTGIEGVVTLAVLYQDDFLVAVDKPAGLLVHRSFIDKYETEFALQKVRDQVQQRVYPVHRLDKPTSGVLLFALSPDIARLLTEQFTLRAVKKTYQALVRGWAADSAEIDYPLKEKLDKMTDAQADQEKAPQSARTRYRNTERFQLEYAIGRYPQSRFSLLTLEPLTGRKHQLRRHMKHIFHPIIGDTTYGEGRYNRFFREQLGLSRLMLASTRLQLNHPVSGESLVINAPLDTDFERALAFMRTHNHHQNTTSR